MSQFDTFTMINLNSMVGRMLKYEDFYDLPKPLNKFDLVNDIPKMELIASVSSINFLIKRPLDLNFQTSLQSQILLIQNIFLVHQNRANIQYCLPHIQTYVQFYNKNKALILFTRVSCLYALNEIINHVGFQNEIVSKFRFSFEQLENIFKFMLLCNDELLEYDKEYLEAASFDKLHEDFFEYTMFKELPHNQYYYIQNPINLIYRAERLAEYLNNQYPEQLQEFIKKYNVSSFDEFTKMIFGYLFVKGDELPIVAYKILKTNIRQISQLDALSSRGHNFKKFEFLEIKKSPIYGSLGKVDNIYLLMDNIFLLEKVYDLFINDFFFEVLSKTIKRPAYGGVVGLFFEEYIDGIFRYSLNGYKKLQYFATSSLMVKGTEHADFYIREKRKVILVQAKSSYLPQGTFKQIATVKEYYSLKANGEIEKFYEKFGLYQLVEKSIEPFLEYAPKVDKGLPKSKLTIFPVLVVTEPIISSSLTAWVFNRKFEDILASKNIPLDHPKYKIQRLMIVHISELERMQEALHNGELNLWDLMYSFSFSTSKRATQKDMYAQFQTVDNLIKKKIKGKAIPNFILKYMRKFATKP